MISNDQDTSDLIGDGSETTKDLNTEIPSDRINLIAAATVFLNSKKIRNSPHHLKRSFLEKKGLTSDEINMAFKLSASLPNQENIVADSFGFITQGSAADDESWFKKIKGFVMSTVAFTGTALAIFEVFQRYLSPLLAGDGKEWQEKLIESQSEMNDNIASLASTVNDLRRQVARSGGEEKERNNENKVLHEMKEDLKNLKSIMLGRNQFPSVPPSRPKLPSWQVDDKAAARSDLESNDGNCLEKMMRDVLLKTREVHCNGSAGDGIGDSCDDDAKVGDYTEEAMTNQTV